MAWGLRQDRIKQLGLLLVITLSPGLPACSGFIRIEPLITPAPTSVEPLPPSTAAVPVSGGGVPTRIVDASIGLDAPVVEMGWRVVDESGQAVSEWVVPENEAGWHRNSARPGQGGNVIISGHNNSQGAHVFGNLDELAVGSRVTVWTDTGQSYLYRVSDKQIVRTFAPSQEAIDYLQAIIQPTPTEQLTLITCWPSWTNTHRLIVIAEPL